MSNKKCILCSLKYNRSDRNPSTLNCGDTFCLKCLTKIYNRKNGKFECPSCQKECDLISTLPFCQKECDLSTIESNSESRTISNSSLTAESIAITESSSELSYKIGLVGDAGTGKTSIIKRFLNEKFEEGLKTTINEEIYFNNIKLKNHNVELQIIDTAGTERYFSLPNIYLRELDGIFLVFAVNNVNSFNSIPYWLKKCKDVIGEDKILFLMGNKTDKEKKISNAQAREFAENHHMRYCHTSAFNGDNIEDAFYDMTKKIYQNNKKNK